MSNDARGLTDYATLVLGAADHASLGVFVVQTVPPRILHANDAAATLVGYSEAELRRRGNPFELVAHEERALLVERLQRALAGESVPPPALTFIRGDGGRVVLDCRIVHREIEGRPGAVVFFTAKEPAPVADIAADARYRELVDAAPDGVTIARGGRFLYANRAALALVGCTSIDDLAQRAPSEMLPSATPRHDYAWSGRDGRTFEASAVTIDFEGAPAVLTFLRDVTASRRAHAELERTQRLAALGTLVAGVAHEVNNPLAYASLGTDLLGRFFDEGCHDVESGRSALSSVAAGLERITTIVRDLRAFARAGDHVVVPVALADVVASALRMTAPMTRPRATVDADVGSLPFVRGSAGSLEQVFVNVLINAAQSFEQNDPSRNRVRVRASCADGSVRVTVDDNGRGICADHLPRVFDPFFTTKSAGDGTGLGLSICHSIVTRDGGSIDVASVPGEGTTVTVVLRAHDDSGLAHACAGTSGGASGAA
ncbi:MAG: PAS domain-containing protein [Labilithrix sp.]|nr:PAS domain-containing protein [Labilithrix sp.]